jgi:peptidylprolyl isomerase
MMLKSKLSIAFFATLCNTLRVCAWTADNGIPRSTAVNRREALIVSSSSVLTGLIAFAPLSALAADSLSDLSAFQDGPSGIKYQILKEGEGVDKPVRAQKVKTKYTLWTGGFGEDGGKQVDSNTGFLGRPLDVIVGVGRVIKGWDLTLLDMRLGEVRRIVVPSDLGYGDAGAGGKILPKAMLFFEVELAEMNRMIDLNDSQKQWLEDNPL